MRPLSSPVLALTIAAWIGLGAVAAETPPAATQTPNPSAAKSQSAVSPATTPDLEKERRWREQIVENLVEGEAVDLQTDGQTFLGIFTPAAGDGSGDRAALVLHGIGVHPDWPQVVHPLRVGLPEHGWSTLSIQMPVLPNGVKESAYLPILDRADPRIEAGIAYLESRGAKRIAIVAHSLGTVMAGRYLAGHPGAVAAYVAIGMSGGAPEAPLDNVRTVARIRTPTLDLYGQYDLEPVVETSDARVRSAVAGGNTGYSQIQVPDANHFFDGQDTALVDTVVQWLNETVPAGPHPSTNQGRAPQ